jgi:hypothetical protein
MVHSIYNIALKYDNNNDIMHFICMNDQNFTHFILTINH